MSSHTYNCGRCRQPLTLRTTSASESLPSLKESQYDLLASHIASIEPRDKGAQAISDASVRAEPLLGRKVVSVPASVLARQTAQQKLFDALSAGSEVDHPLCSDCAEGWAASMAKTIEGLKEERELLINYEKDAIAKKDELGARNAFLVKDTERLAQEEKDLVQQLLAAEKQMDDLDLEMQQLDEEEKQLEAEEADFWKAHSQYLVAYNAHVQDSRSLLLSYQSTQNTLRKLQMTNVYNDAFCIGHDGGLATINGLRLGRLPSVQVEWSEINAAWGATLLLLKTLAKKYGCEIQGYNLVPMGSFSKIEKLSSSEKGTILELYGSGDWALGRLLQNRRFDSAMVAFLECLRQVVLFAEDNALEQNVDLRIPHQIHKDKIGDVSIRLGSSDETWTRALRHVLLDLKILLKNAVE